MSRFVFRGVDQSLVISFLNYFARGTASAKQANRVIIIKSSMKIAMLIPDDRDEFKEWNQSVPRFGTAPTALLEGFSYSDDCEIHVVCCVHRPLRSPEKLARNIWYHQVIVPKWGWRFAYIGCIRAIRRKLRELNPDLVHGQGTERYCGLAAAFSGYANIITVHGNMRTLRKALGAKWFSFHGLASLLESITLRITWGVVCLTTYTKERVSELARHIWLIPNAVNSQFFELDRKINGAPTIFCAANIDVRKNQNQLIRVFDQIETRDSLQLVFAGRLDATDPYAAEFLRLCAERSWCHYCGSLNTIELQAVLRQAAILVLPSLEDNCPMVILEAMAVGVPVAASNLGGIPELIEDGATGVLFDPAKESEMKDKIEGLLSDPLRAERLSNAAKSKALREYTPQRIAARHLDVYRSVLSQRSPKRNG